MLPYSNDNNLLLYLLVRPQPHLPRIRAESCISQLHCSLASLPYTSSPSDLPGSYPTSLLGLTALSSSIVNIQSRPASPAAEPSFYLSTLSVSTTQSSLPARDPSNSVTLYAPTTPSTSTMPVTVASVASAATYHTIIVLLIPAGKLNKYHYQERAS